MAKNRKVWISEEMYRILIEEKNRIKEKLGIDPPLTQVSKILAYKYKPQEFSDIKIPRTKRKKWVFEFDFNPKF